MRHSLQLAAALLIVLPITAAVTVRAQVSNPDKLIPAPPSAHVPQRAQGSDDLQWLWPFTRPRPVGRAADLRVDARFQTALAREFKQQQAMWGSDPERRPALASIIPLFVTQYGAVSSSDNRYISVDGCVPSFCSAEGLLWVDMGQHGIASPLMIFTAINWTAEGVAANEPGASYEMWLYSNKNLDPNALPFALTTAIADWNARLAAAHRLVPHITQALLIEPSGAPYALNPELAGANTIAPQPDTVTPQPSEN